MRLWSQVFVFTMLVRVGLGLRPCVSSAPVLSHRAAGMDHRRNIYRRCPSGMPSFSACCRKALAVRFMAREIFATAV
jgi:hypothetical protein